jgi:hypothetical protein
VAQGIMGRGVMAFRLLYACTTLCSVVQEKRYAWYPVSAYIEQQNKHSNAELADYNKKKREICIL